MNFGLSKNRLLDEEVAVHAHMHAFKICMKLMNNTITKSIEVGIILLIYQQPNVNISRKL